MMEGRLEPKKAERWAWSARLDDIDGACESYMPTRDIKDMKQEYARQVQEANRDSISPIVCESSGGSSNIRTQKLPGNL
jgi:hypothetical protein